jgi:hypothetical protein
LYQAEEQYTGKEIVCKNQKVIRTCSKKKCADKETHLRVVLKRAVFEQAK